MSRTTTIFCLALFSVQSMAQKYPRLLEKMGLKDLQQKMIYIPAKSFTSLAHTGSDSVSAYRSRTSTVEGFYISKTEVTNREYREFVYYVRDSIAHTLLSHFKGDGPVIDWSIAIDWRDQRLEPIMVDREYSFTGKNEPDAQKILYKLDLPGSSEVISIYPDTLAWIRDFTYSYNEPLVKRYFSHASYDDFPVVGVNQKQALAFCQWRSIRINWSVKAGMAPGMEIKLRLPNNAEWESAAFDGMDTVRLSKKSGNYLYNFGNIVEGNRITIKTYRDDGYFYTAPVKSFPEGAYDLYDMKGNVSEWTSTPMEEVMNAEVRTGKANSIFVVKGGGWNSTPFYLQAGACQFFPAEATHSYIGFRYILRITAN